MLDALALPVQLAAPPAQPCGSWAEFRAVLKDRYGETPAATFVGPAGKVAYVVTVAPSGSWTLLVLAGDGRACVQASGAGWMPHGHLGAPS